LIDDTVTGADFTDAVVTGGIFREMTGLSAEQLYSTANYQQGDLTGIRLEDNDLSGWSFAGKNLSEANFYRSTLAGTDFTDAVVTRTSFRGFGGITAEQLYSTATYQQGDLSGMSLAENDLRGWDFAGKDLSDVSLAISLLAGADFAGAIVKGAIFTRPADGGFTADQLYSTASYQQGDLRGVYLGANDLTGWDFAGKDLSGASFREETLTGADFTDAVVKGADFEQSTGFTAEQLYSTASYKQGDLSGTSFRDANLTGWDFAGKDLGDAIFGGASLAGADLTGASLVAVDSRGTSLAGADLRAATGFVIDEGYGVPQPDIRNLIWPSGEVYGLHLIGEHNALVIRDNEVPVTISGNFRMNDDSLLQFILNDASWESRIQLADGVSPKLGGTLAVTLSPAADLAQFVGQTLDLFDWNSGLEPNNVFSRIEFADGHWDFSQLYGTGEVVLTALPGDSNGDFEFNQLDIIEVLAAGKYVSGEPAVWNEGDWNNDGLFNQLDIVAAQQVGIYLTGPYAGLNPEASVAAVPELSGFLLLGMGLVALAFRRSRVRIDR
jgi:uncharacterized protein YjbI with pentapeptide repeats